MIKLHKFNFNKIQPNNKKKGDWIMGDLLFKKSVLLGALALGVSLSPVHAQSVDEVTVTGSYIEVTVTGSYIK